MLIIEAESNFFKGLFLGSYNFFKGLFLGSYNFFKGLFLGYYNFSKGLFIDSYNFLKGLLNFSQAPFFDSSKQTQKIQVEFPLYFSSLMLLKKYRGLSTRYSS